MRIAIFDLTNQNCRNAVAIVLRYARRNGRTINYWRDLHLTELENGFVLDLDEPDRHGLLAYLIDRGVNVTDATRCDFCERYVTRHLAETDDCGTVSCHECIGVNAIRCDVSGDLFPIHDANIIHDLRDGNRYTVSPDVSVDYETLADWLNCDVSQIEYVGDNVYRIKNHTAGLIYDYHDGPRRFKNPAKTNRARPPVGIELEISVSANRANADLAFARAVRERFDESIVVFERDSSLDDASIECVFAPLDYVELTNVIRQFLDIGAAFNIAGDELVDYGLHVNVRPQLSSFELAKLLTFINDPANVQLLYVLAGRDYLYESRFCCDYGKNAREKINCALRKYRAVHVKRGGLLEFRLFQSTVYFETLFARIDATHALLNFCRRASCANLRAGEFLNYVAANYESYLYLYNYLTRSEFFVLTERNQFRLIKRDEIWQ